MYYVPSSLLNPRVYIQLYHLVIFVCILQSVFYFSFTIIIIIIIILHVTLYEQKHKRNYSKKHHHSVDMNSPNCEWSEVFTVDWSIHSKVYSWQGQLNLSNVKSSLKVWLHHGSRKEWFSLFNIFWLILCSLASKTSGKPLVNFYLVEP